MKFFVDIHAIVNHANDSDFIGVDSVKDQMQAHYKTTEPRSKCRSRSPDEWETGQIVEVGIDPLNESIGRIRAAFIKMAIDTK